MVRVVNMSQLQRQGFVTYHGVSLHYWFYPPEEEEETEEEFETVEVFIPSIVVLGKDCKQGEFK